MQYSAAYREITTLINDHDAYKQYFEENTMRKHDPVVGRQFIVENLEKYKNNQKSSQNIIGLHRNLMKGNPYNG